MKKPGRKKRGKPENQPLPVELAAVVISVLSIRGYLDRLLDVAWRKGHCRCMESLLVSCEEVDG